MAKTINNRSLIDDHIEENERFVSTEHHHYPKLLTPDVEGKEYGEESDSTLLSKISEADNSLKLWQKRRYLLALFAFLGLLVAYALRVNLHVAIVSMTESKSITLENGTVTYTKEFDWNSKQQGFILSSFFYGYIFTQLPGGWLATKYGGIRLFGIGIAATSVLTILTPCATKQSIYLLIFLRLTEGLFEGITYPCLLEIWSRWAPPLERGKLVMISISGTFAGIVISMPVSAYLSNGVGWESIFYVFGTIGIFWYIGLIFIISESPFEDPQIKNEELQYLRLSLGKHNHNKNIKHPWMSIFTSPAVLAITFSHFTENWGYYTLLTQLPKFMKDVLHFELEKVGMGSAIPYVVMGIAMPIAGYLADKIQEKKICSTTHVRKIFTCCAFISQTTFMLTAIYLSSPVGTTACIALAVGLGSFAWAGVLMNYLDIAPQHVGVLVGISNTVATLPGILSPILAGYIVVTPTSSEWQIVFFISSGIYLCGAIIYFIFATAEIQEWAIEKPKINCEIGADYKK